MPARTRDAEGRPFGVRYDLLSVVSLAVLQQQVAIVRAQGAELAEQRRELAQLAALRERVAALESAYPPKPRRILWWRCSGDDRDSP